ncbi:uncharacterized protein BDZ99DRAFT_260670 [Mytilinidion resinicola]|uniref:Uncharacterized protein n=1 Tax=Mytilinidion resinicola TaxID=574789 RepID=A0A6A6YVZ3_9PEZI|nr:uncharacterized protein BDZ99DRAFT_260670 [Mytilinidion resinicola]KAF2812077.1 hypothetical protein BDZ99DRAFT_260670 [Mytilinidion resinicola]
MTRSKTLPDAGTTGADTTRFKPYVRVKREPDADAGGGIGHVPEAPNSGLSQSFLDGYGSAPRRLQGIGQGARDESPSYEKLFDSLKVPTGPRGRGGPQMAFTAPGSGAKNANLEPLGHGTWGSRADRTATVNAFAPPLTTSKALRQPSEEGELAESSPAIKSSPYSKRGGLLPYTFGAPLTAPASLKRNATEDEHHDLVAKRLKTEDNLGFIMKTAPFRLSSCPIQFGTADTHHRLGLLDEVPDTRDTRIDDDETGPKE